MSDKNLSVLEERLRAAALSLPYPDTPDLSKTFPWERARTPLFKPRSRRFAWSAALVVVFFAAMFSAPSVRARVIEFIQIGVVRIFLADPTATPQDTVGLEIPQSPAVSPSAASTQKTPRSPTITPVVIPTQTYLVSVLQLNGETTLEDARTQFDYPIRLPAYPPDLSLPDYVFLNDLGTGQYVVLAWLDPDNPEEVRLSLYILAPGTQLSKGLLATVAETRVNDLPAFWTDGPYLLSVDGVEQKARLVDAHALIWEEAGLTYRLEVDLPLAEAVRIAESLE